MSLPEQNDGTGTKLLRAGLVMFVVVAAVNLVATLLFFAAICGLAAAALLGTGNVGLATIPGAAALTLVLGVVMFVIVPIRCVIHERNLQSVKRPTLEGQLGRSVMAIFGACVGASSGAIFGSLIAFTTLGWPGGLLAVGVLTVTFAAFGYASPEFGGEFLNAVFDWICSFVGSISRMFE